MGKAYVAPSIVGYNTSPPPDDGSNSIANIITWAGIKSKLTDPELTFISNMNLALTAALDFTGRVIAGNDTCTTADHMRTIECTAALVATLPDTLATGAGFTVGYKNTGSGVVSVNLLTSADTLEGVAAGVADISAGGSIVFKINEAATGYYILQSTGSVTVNGISTSPPPGLATTVATLVANQGVIIPNSKSSNYTTVIGDVGEGITHPTADITARLYHIDGSLAYPDGACITFTNEPGAGALTIDLITTGTLYLAGVGSTGARTLTAPGIATAMKMAGTSNWLISGVGLT